MRRGIRREFDAGRVAATAQLRCPARHPEAGARCTKDTGHDAATEELWRRPHTAQTPTATYLWTTGSLSSSAP